jgi:hypothetical protein
MKHKADQYAEVLEAAGIPVHSESSSGLLRIDGGARRAALLSVLDNQRQDVPLAAVLRSPLAAFGGRRTRWRGSASPTPRGEGCRFTRPCPLRRRAKDDELAEWLRTFLAQLERWRQARPNAPARGPALARSTMTPATSPTAAACATAAARRQPAVPARARAQFGTFTARGSRGSSSSSKPARGVGPRPAAGLGPGRGRRADHERAQIQGAGVPGRIPPGPGQAPEPVRGQRPAAGGPRTMPGARGRGRGTAGALPVARVGAGGGAPPSAGAGGGAARPIRRGDAGEGAPDPGRDVRRQDAGTVANSVGRAPGAAAGGDDLVGVHHAGMDRTGDRGARKRLRADDAHGRGRTRRGGGSGRRGEADTATGRARRIEAADAGAAAERGGGRGDSPPDVSVPACRVFKPSRRGGRHRTGARACGGRRAAAAEIDRRRSRPDGGRIEARRRISCSSTWTSASRAAAKTWQRRSNGSCTAGCSRRNRRPPWTCR